MKQSTLNHIKVSCTRALVATALGGACIVQAQSLERNEQGLQEKRRYSIPAGPLSESLLRFARESDVILSFDAKLLEGRQSEALNGSFSINQGLSELLRGHGLAHERSVNGIGIRSTSADKPIVPSLRTVTIVADSVGTVSAYNKDMIESLPSLNGDIGSHLKLHPGIQFAENQLSSQTGGEISPAEISIHGAKSYQNEFLIDGTSIANDIDPGSKSAANPTSTADIEFVPAGSQAMALDVAQMCNIKVLDNNVSAEYGRFTGGVVQAELCKARETSGGKVSVAYTGSNWTNLIIDPSKQAAFENSSTADDQPHFRKWTYKASAEMRPSADWGIAVSTVRRTSDIPLRQFTSSGQTTTQTRLNDSIALKADWSPESSRDSADLSLMYAPSEGSYFIKNAKNSDYILMGGGLALSGRLVRALDGHTLTQQLSYSETTQSRQGDANFYTPWRYSSVKNWGDTSLFSNPVTTTSIEGSLGSVDQVLQTWNYKIKSQANTWLMGDTKHTLSAGLDLKQQNAQYQRVGDLNQHYSTPTQITAWTSALTQAGCEADPQACSVGPTLSSGSLGQYFRNRYVYKSGSMDVDAQSFGAFLEDSLRRGSWTWRLGARADYDSLVDDTNIAPRSSVEWDVSDALRLSAGANRYYGRSLMAYALQEKVRTLRYTQTRNAGSLMWNAATQSRPANRLQDIDSPYDDELHLGAQWDRQGGGQWSLGLTAREGKSQIVKRIITKQTGCDANQCYVYTNQGGSTTTDLTLGWNSNEPWKKGGTETSAWAAFNKSDVRSNYNSYADTYGASDDEIIQYDGQFIRYADMPADNFNRPWTLRLATTTKVPKHQLSVSNVVRIRAGYEQMTQSGTTDYNGTTVDVWSRTKLPESVTLDTVFQWTPYVHKKQQLDFKLTIENILDRANMTTASTTYATYERGRTFLLEVGYKF